MIPRLLGLGTACPPGVMSQHDAAIMAVSRCATNEREAKLLPELYRRSTVKQRRSVLLPPNNGQAQDATAVDDYFPPASVSPRGPTTATRMASFAKYAPPLAAQACIEALADAELSSQRITHLVTVTCTGFVAPGVEHQLIKDLGLPGHINRTQVGFMGCHGALSGLQVARAMARADPNARVLMVCIELCSLHFQYGWHPQRVVSNALFADGAAALILGQSDDSSLYTLVDTASKIIPDSHDDMTWTIGDHGFEMTLSPGVPHRISQHIKPWLTDWLVGHDLSLDQIQSYAIHPGGPRIVAAVAQALDLEGKAIADSLEILAQYGNMSSATLLFILHKQRAAGLKRPCLAMSFGPGLAAEAALLT